MNFLIKEIWNKQLMIIPRQSTIHPENSELYYSRAEAKIGLNEFLSAAVDYTNIISFDSLDATAYYNRGICYANIEIKGQCL